MLPRPLLAPTSACHIPHMTNYNMHDLHANVARASKKFLLTAVLSVVTTEIRAARNPARRKNLRGHANSFANLILMPSPQRVETTRLKLTSLESHSHNRLISVPTFLSVAITALSSFRAKVREMSPRETFKERL